MTTISLFLLLSVSPSQKEVLPRFELGVLDSESRVLTVTPQDHMHLSNNTPS